MNNKRIEQICNVSSFFSIVNRNFWRNWYIVIILLLMPIAIMLLNTLNSNNIFILNQSIPSVLQINIFIINFFIVPIMYFLFNNSCFIQINQFNVKIRGSLLISILLYYLIVTLASFIWSILVVFFFGYTPLSNEVFNSSGKLVKIFNEYTFSIEQISCPELGIFNYPKPNWLMLLIACLMAYVYYGSLGLTFASYFKKINNLIFILIVLSVMSISMGGILLNLSTTLQIRNVEIISFFNLSMFITIFSFFMYMSANIENIPTIYSFYDIDISFNLMTKTTIIVSISLILSFTLIAIVLIYLKLDNIIRFSNRIFNRKKFLLIKDETCSFEVKYYYKFKPEKKNIVINTAKTSVIGFENSTKLRRFINSLNRNYLVNYFQYSNLLSNEFANIIYLLEYDHLDLKDFSIRSINRVLKMGDKDLHDRLNFIKDFYELKKLIVKKDDKNIDTFNDYLIKLAYLLNTNVKGIIIEIPRFTNKELISILKQKASEKNIAILFIYVNK